MEKTQRYLGAENGVVFCADHVEGGEICGKAYHSYRCEPLEIKGIGRLISGLEKFYDSICFPHPGVNERSFQENVNKKQDMERRMKVMSDEELLRRHGELGTFIIRVQHRQNGSWQGRITWTEKDKTIYFRSVWEMVKLIEGALDAAGCREEKPFKENWEEE